MGSEVEDDGEGAEPTEVPVVFAIAAGLAAEATGLLLHDPARSFLSAGVLPIYLEATKGIARLWDKRKIANMTQVVYVAAEDLGMTAEGFLERVQRDERLVSLTGQAMAAAAATVLQQKIKALGKIVACGVRDDAKVDESAMFIAALGDLEVPHVRALVHFAKDYHLAELGSGAKPIVQHDLNWGRPQYRTIDQIEREMPEFGIALYPVVATLARHGLIEEELPDIAGALKEYDRSMAQDINTGTSMLMNADRYANGGWRISQFGVALRDYLEERGSDEGPEAPNG